MKRIEAACAALVPEVLAQYLWQFVDATAEDCFIRLTARKLGLGNVQEIAVRPDGAAICRTVFGFEPVDAVLRVRRAGDDLTMDIAEPSPGDALF